MKFITRKPRDGWISPYTIVEKCWPWHNWDDVELDDYPVLAVKLATIISRTISWTVDKCKPQQFRVKLDPWDTWSLDYTLAQIIHPLLVQLHKTSNDRDTDIDIGLSRKGSNRVHEIFLARSDKNRLSQEKQAS